MGGGGPLTSSRSLLQKKIENDCLSDLDDCSTAKIGLEVSSLAVGAWDLRRMDGGELPAEDTGSTAASTADTDSVLGITFLDELWGIQDSSILLLQLNYLEPRDIFSLTAAARAFCVCIQDFTFELAIWVLHGLFERVRGRR